MGTAYRIPVADGSFDSALSTAALEHLEEPEDALRELHRVLRPGGAALYTVPLIWHVHSEPWDVYRSTEHGLQHLLEKAGFEILELRALSVFGVTFAQLFVYCYLYRFQRGQMKYLPVIPLVGRLVQAIAYVLDTFDRAERWTWIYLVVEHELVAVPRSRHGALPVGGHATA